jgi:hypothetical protein
LNATDLLRLVDDSENVLPLFLAEERPQFTCKPVLALLISVLDLLKS